MPAVRRATALKALWDVLRTAHRPGVPGVRERFAAVPRMVFQGMTGQYPYLAKGRLGLVLLGLIYVISPVDLVPELWLLVLGLGDDAVVVAWMAGIVLSETEAFLAWERGRAQTVIGEIIP